MIPQQCHLWTKGDVTDTDLNTSFETVETFSEESHESLQLVRCKQCTQLYVKSFYEEIDWVGGDDAQEWTYVPVESLEEARQIGNTGAGALPGMIPRLEYRWPTDKEKRIVWIR